MKRILLLALIVLLTACFDPWCARTLGETATVTTVGRDKQLFIDDYIVHSMEQMSRIFHQPRKSVPNPVLKGDKPWEPGSKLFVGTVIYDEEEHLFKMWYDSMEIHATLPPPPWDQYESVSRAAKYREKDRVCYATSKDGIHWVRPELGLVEFNGSKRNNLLPTAPFVDRSIIKDAHEKDPARRYKAACYWTTEGDKSKYGLGVFFSPDGLHWTAYEGNPVIGGTGDEHNLIGWDERLQKYVGYFRPGWSKDQPDYERLSPVAGKLRVRTIGYSVSDDFIHWSPIAAALLPDDQDPVDTQFYSMPAMKYESYYLGFPWVFRTNEITHIPQLVFSRDGQHFSRTPGHCDFLPLGPAGSFDDGNVYDSRPFVHGDKIWIYYTGGRWRGAQELSAGGDKATDAVGLATLPLDGFVSIEAGPNPGVLTTKPLVFSGEKLMVNFDESYKGYVGIDEKTSLRVEILDQEGHPVAGYSADEADVVAHTDLHHTVSWKGKSDVAALAGKPVRVRFHVRNGRLYAFQFQ